MRGPIQHNSYLNPVKGPATIGAPQPMNPVQKIASEWADPGLALKNFSNDILKPVVVQGAADITKGVTMGMIDPYNQRVFGQKTEGLFSAVPNKYTGDFETDMQMALKDGEKTGFRTGEVIPFLKGTMFDQDIKPLEWIGAGKPVGMISRGLYGAGKKIGMEAFTKAVASKVPKIVAPIVPMAGRFLNSLGTGYITGAGFGYGATGDVNQANKSGLEGAAFAGLIHTASEGLMAISQIPAANMTAKRTVLQKTVGKMAEYMYGKGMAQSLEEAQIKAGELMNREVIANNGLKGMKWDKIIEVYNAADAFSKFTKQPEPVNVTPESTLTGEPAPFVRPSETEIRYTLEKSKGIKPTQDQIDNAGSMQGTAAPMTKAEAIAQGMVQDNFTPDMTGRVTTSPKEINQWISSRNESKDKAVIQAKKHIYAESNDLFKSKLENVPQNDTMEMVANGRTYEFKKEVLPNGEERLIEIPTGEVFRRDIGVDKDGKEFANYVSEGVRSSGGNDQMAISPLLGF
jgi:hypothetical protein